MKLDSPVDAPAEDLLATLMTLQNSLTPVDSRKPKETVAAYVPAVGDVILDRYRILAWAGVGTANVVFRGEHVEMQFSVAIKIVNRQHYPERAIVLGHLRNEAMMLARLRHPNVARLWDFSETADFPCLVTDFIDGKTLRQMIQLAGRLDQRQTIRAAVHIAEALAAIGRGGIVHRDIKPENVVLCTDGSAKLIDFGLAIVQGQENPDAHGNRLAIPRVGTVAYLAPEQARNSIAVDHRADIYSLGATLYHAVTGRLPFGGNNAAQVILRHLEDEPVPPRSIVPNLHDDVSNVILQMMAKKPRDRFANAQELLESLRDIQRTLGTK